MVSLQNTQHDNAFVIFGVQCQRLWHRSVNITTLALNVKIVPIDDK